MEESANSTLEVLVTFGATNVPTRSIRARLFEPDTSQNIVLVVFENDLVLIVAFVFLDATKTIHMISIPYILRIN
jgi:hypothetical protein